MTLELTDDNFEAFMSDNEQPVVIDFMAAWCAPCKSVGKALDAMAVDYTGRAQIGKVDVDTNPVLTQKFGVRNMPTVLFIHKGEVLDKHVGSAPRSVFEEKLRAML